MALKNCYTQTFLPTFVVVKYNYIIILYQVAADNCDLEGISKPEIYAYYVP